MKPADNASSKNKKKKLGNNPFDWIQKTGGAAVAEKHEKEDLVQEERIEGGGGAPRNIDNQEIKNSRNQEIVKKKRRVQPKKKHVKEVVVEDVVLYTTLRSDQVEFLEQLVRAIMYNRERGYKEERITKNSLLRACIDRLRELGLGDMDVLNIPNEEELRERVNAVIG